MGRIIPQVWVAPGCIVAAEGLSDVPDPKRTANALHGALKTFLVCISSQLAAGTADACIAGGRATLGWRTVRCPSSLSPLRAMASASCSDSGASPSLATTPTVWHSTWHTASLRSGTPTDSPLLRYTAGE